jgi:hypothetical protein
LGVVLGLDGVDLESSLVVDSFIRNAKKSEERNESKIQNEKKKQRARSENPTTEKREMK